MPKCNGTSERMCVYHDPREGVLVSSSNKKKKDTHVRAWGVGDGMTSCRIYVQECTGKDLAWRNGPRMSYTVLIPGYQRYSGRINREMLAR